MNMIDAIHEAIKFPVSPDDQLFVLTQGQLRDLISQAVLPLQDRLERLEADLQTLKEIQAEDNELRSIEIAQDRQRISRLELKKIQPMHQDRGEILRALLAANGGKMLAIDARRTMRLSKELFSQLVASMPNDIETRPLRSDKRKKVLVLK